MQHFRSDEPAEARVLPQGWAGMIDAEADAMLALARPGDCSLPPADLRRLPVLERGDGRAELRFFRRRGRTVLGPLYQRAPLRVLFPREPNGFAETAVLVTTSGGIAGGDRFALSVDCADGAEATVTQQAAEKVYRSTGAAAAVAAEIAVGAGARLEWLPQETILFDGARLQRRADIRLAEDASLLACDMLTFGRGARGERFAAGHFLDRWQVRRGGRLAWVDALALDGNPAARLDARFGLGGAAAMGTVLYGAPRAAELLEAARNALADAACRAGAGLVNGLLLARLLGGAAEVRQALARCLGTLRQLAFGLPAALPRVWSC